MIRKSKSHGCADRIVESWSPFAPDFDEFSSVACAYLAVVFVDFYDRADAIRAAAAASHRLVHRSRRGLH